MSTAVNNGGPAFPYVHDIEPEKGFARALSIETGMTLRDYFAAHCPITFAEAQVFNTTGEDKIVFFCTFCFEYADAMIWAGAK